MFLNFETIPNVRDLGGIILPGGTVKYGLLLRGGALGDASDEEIGLLENHYHLAHIFDFRTEGEKSRKPDREVAGTDNIWLPAIDPSNMTLADRSLPDEAYAHMGLYLIEHANDPMIQEVARHMYTDLVTNEYTQVQYAAFMEKVLDTPEGAAVYWHCSQGKDRTGIGAALILSALGADRKTIMDDFALSNIFYEGMVARCKQAVLAKGWGDAECEVVQTFVGVNTKYFEDALDVIDREFGSMMAYLKGPLCLTDSDIKRLRNRYLE